MALQILIDGNYISLDHSLIQLLTCYVRLAVGAYDHKKPFLFQFPIMKILTLLRTKSREAYELLSNHKDGLKEGNIFQFRGILPICEKTARELYINYYSQGVNLTAIDFLLKATSQKKINLVLSTDGIALKPSANRLENVIVGGELPISKNEIRTFDIKKFKFLKSYMVFQMGYVDDPSVNVVVAVYGYNKKGFCHTSLANRISIVINKIKARATELKKEVNVSCVVSDQESIYTKYSSLTTTTCLFDVAHLAKCMRNSFCNHLLLLHNTLINTRHLIETGQLNNLKMSDSRGR